MTPTSSSEGLDGMGQMVLFLLLLGWVGINYWLSHREFLSFVFNRWWIIRQRDDFNRRINRGLAKLVRKETHIHGKACQRNSHRSL